MILNGAGKMVENIWIQTINPYANLKLNEFIIMPNYFHAIIEISTPVGAESISAQIPEIIRIGDKYRTRNKYGGKYGGKYGICPYGDENGVDSMGNAII